MAGAFVDGALKGFNMMERHKSRMFNQQRLSDLDDRNEQRYEQQQSRLSEMDKERRNNREQDVQWREQQAQDTKDYRQQTQQAAEDQRQWSRNYQDQQAQWQKDQKLIPLAVQSFRDTGKIPEELEGVMSRNKGMDPRSYLKEEYRNSVKGLNTTLDKVIESGNMAEANNPTTIKLFDEVFGEKLKASVGQYDDDVKSKIASVDFAGFVPVEDKEGRVSLALKITYANGAQEIKPMTKGRTSEGDDPVMTYTPKELVHTIKSRAMMADMIERPEYWDRIGAQMGAGQASGKGGKSAYTNELSSLQDQMMKDYTKIQSSTDYMDETEREAALGRVEEVYKQRIYALAKQYGVAPTKAEGQEKPSDKKGSDEKAGENSKDDLVNKVLNGNAKNPTLSTLDKAVGGGTSTHADPTFAAGYARGLGGLYDNSARPIDESDLSPLEKYNVSMGHFAGGIPGLIGDAAQVANDKVVKPTLDYLTTKPSERNK